MVTKVEQDYWENVSKPQEIIVCAANRHKVFKTDILLGVRHWDKLMYNQVKSNRSWNVFPSSSYEQGFINQFGEFRTREEAYKIVQENGQPFNTERNGCDKELYSEGLY